MNAIIEKYQGWIKEDLISLDKTSENNKADLATIKKKSHYVYEAMCLMDERDEDDGFKFFQKQHDKYKSQMTYYSEDGVGKDALLKAKRLEQARFTVDALIEARDHDDYDKFHKLKQDLSWVGGRSGY
jgi:hypothetical protein